MMNSWVASLEGSPTIKRCRYDVAPHTRYLQPSES